MGDLSSLGIIDIALALMNSAARPKYDEICDAARVLVRYMPFYQCSLAKFKSLGAGTSPRDFVNISRLRFESDGSILVPIKFISHPDAPESVDLVRGRFLKGGYILRPHASNPKKATVV